MSGSHNLKKMLIGGVSPLMLVAAFAAAPAAAQEGAQAEAPASDGEIIVTAQKREERLQDVPLAVTAVTGDTLQERQINDTNSLAAAVPSLTYTQGANPANTSFRIRGVGTQLFGQGTESSVSVVVDGVVTARAAQGFSELADIERIEVLRGPQGTLFGRNASAGLINVVTARPSRDFSGKAEIVIAEGDEYRARGTVSGPLSDTLRARLTGYYTKIGGYVDNLATGREDNGSEGWGLRGKLEWDATDNLNILFAGDYRKLDANCCTTVAVSLVTPALVALNPGITPGYANRQKYENAQVFSNSSQWTASMTAELDLDSVAVTSITAFQKYELSNNNPADGFDSLPIIYIPRTQANWVNLDNQGGSVSLKNFSQELRIASTGDRPVNFVAGLYYNHMELDRPFSRVQVRCNQRPAGQPQLATLAICPADRIQNFSSAANFLLKTDHYAAFGQVEPKITDKLKAILGIRVQHEKGSNFAQQFGPISPGDTHAVNGMVGPFPIEGTKSAADTAITGRAGLQYEFSRDAQAYATYTRGYKGQGYNLESATDPVNQSILAPENVDAYEVGFKFTSSDRTFGVNVAAFYAKYDNLQVQANRGDPLLGNVQFEAVNAGSSETKGVEIEGWLRPAPGFTTNFGVTYAKSVLDLDGNQCPLQQQATAPTVTAGNIPFNTCVRIGAGTPFQNLRSSTLPNSPAWRLSFAPRYEHEFGAMKAFAQFTVNMQSSVNFGLGEDPLLKQEGYALVDATIGLAQVDDRWNITLFGKNLFNKHYVTSLAHNQPMATVQFPLDINANISKDSDRYFGVSIGTRF